MVRSPVVAILGHVDHGKTSLLDYIQKSSITDREHGGITQKIGAYEIATGIKGYPTDTITFIDTPGHEAFAQLRSRGANVADIAILVIDGTDSLMPQTIESIAHIKAANIPFIVTVNKMDLPTANPEKIARDLLQHEVIVENKGGKVLMLPISAKTGQGVQELLEAILFIASDLHLAYDEKAPSEAFIIEEKREKRGIVVSIVMRNGTLSVGDLVYTKQQKVKIKALFNDQGKSVPSVTPSSPCEVLGFIDLPEVGTLITAMPTKEPGVSQTPALAPLRTIDMAAILGKKAEEKKQLSVIIRAESQGSLEAILQSIKKNDRVKVVLSAIGEIHRSDIFLAKTTQAIVIGFQVGIDTEAEELAKQEKVIIKTYNIIYKLLEELLEVSTLLEEKEQKQKNLKGEGKVLATFIIEGEKVAGVKLTKGKIAVGDPLQLVRNGQVINTAKLVSLQIRAKKVQEVKKDQECGMIISPPLDTRQGDVIQCIL